VEQRRLLLAFLLSLLLLIAYQELVLKRYQPHAPAPETPKTAPAMPPTASTLPPPVASAPAGGLTADVQGVQVVHVETDEFRAAITTAGARLMTLELKAYRKTIEPDSPPLELVSGGKLLSGTLALGSEEGDAGVVYRPDRQELRLTGAERGEIVFSGQGPKGIAIEKRYVFTGNGYLIELEAAVDGGEVPASLGLILAAIPSASSETAHEHAIGLAKGRLVQHALTDLENPAILDDPSWAGFATQYFLLAGMSEGASARAVFGRLDSQPVARLVVPVTDKRAGFVLYAGPKDREILAQAGHDLGRALDFGWFWFVAVPLLQGLKFLNHLTGNYGIAIIVLTALVKVATIPLTGVTFRNMREMQKLQPQMAKLRERFKDDAAGLQREMMELYRRHRVNPLSGCLPLVLQIPVFVGLYNALSNAIELRHAPFMWIPDLSAPEWLLIAGIWVPVLTILMGVSMFVQQWLTPQQGDPAQQRVMMVMPLLFTVMFINFPAGLVLYWLVNNILTIGQQYIMLRSAT
jgi:YidC/Oxa1 family membrane protein insertase